jgi:hypothetical protein
VALSLGNRPERTSRSVRPLGAFDDGSAAAQHQCPDTEGEQGDHQADDGADPCIAPLEPITPTGRHRRSDTPQSTGLSDRVIEDRGGNRRGRAERTSQPCRVLADEWIRLADAQVTCAVPQGGSRVLTRLRRFPNNLEFAAAMEVVLSEGLSNPSQPLADLISGRHLRAKSIEPAAARD